MTGAGTQTDPYIIDTWADFVTAIGTTDAYVKADTSSVKVWDFAKMVEGGITASISWNAREFDGDGLTIKGIYGTAQYFFSSINSNVTKIIKNTNFLDFVKTATHSVTQIFSSRFEFRNCQFSGIIEGASLIAGSSGVIFTTGSVEGGEPKGCAFALKLSGSAKISSATSTSSAPTYNHCHFELDGESSATEYMKMQECKISGFFPWQSFTNSGGGQNVIDAEVSAIGTWNNSGGGVTLVNTDKLAEGLTVPTGFTGVTSAQMLDVDALAAVGFVAVAEEDPEGGE